MTRQQRLNELLDALARAGHLDVEEIVDQFDISLATARRDLASLAEQGLVTRTHGGAVAIGNAYELPLQYRIARSMEAKVSIARLAATLVTPGQVVGLTGGTTTTQIARELCSRTRADAEPEPPELVLVTNALNIAYEAAIRPSVRIVLTGGVVRSKTFELIGHGALTALDEVAIDCSFIGVDALTTPFGAAAANEAEAQINRRLAEVATRVVIVADSTKFTQSAIARILPLDRIDTLITDAPPPAPLADALHHHGVEVLCTSSPQPRANKEASE